MGVAGNRRWDLGLKLWSAATAVIVLAVGLTLATGVILLASCSRNATSETSGLHGNPSQGSTLSLPAKSTLAASTPTTTASTTTSGNPVPFLDEAALRAAQQVVHAYLIAVRNNDLGAFAELLAPPADQDAAGLLQEERARLQAAGEKAFLLRLLRPLVWAGDGYLLEPSGRVPREIDAWIRARPSERAAMETTMMDGSARLFRVEHAADSGKWLAVPTGSALMSSRQVEVLMAFIRGEGRRNGNTFLPTTDLQPHEQPTMAPASGTERKGYRINYEIDMEALRFLVLGVDPPDLTAAYRSLQAEDRLTPTGISFEGHEWYQGETTDGGILFGVEIPAGDPDVDPYSLTIRVSAVDEALGVEIAGAMKRYADVTSQ